MPHGVVNSKLFPLSAGRKRQYQPLIEIVYNYFCARLLFLFVAVHHEMKEIKSNPTDAKYLMLSFLQCQGRMVDYDNPTNESSYSFLVFQSGCRYFNETTDSWETDGVTVS